MRNSIDCVAEGMRFAYILQADPFESPTRACALPFTKTMPLTGLYLAEGVRFELTEDLHPRQFSRLVHSTALPTFLQRALYRSPQAMGNAGRQSLRNIC